MQIFDMKLRLSPRPPATSSLARLLACRQPADDGTSAYGPPAGRGTHAEPHERLHPPTHPAGSRFLVDALQGRLKGRQGDRQPRFLFWNLSGTWRCDKKRNGIPATL
jgi:hypothetical protein